MDWLFVIAVIGAIFSVAFTIGQRAAISHDRKKTLSRYAVITDFGLVAVFLLMALGGDGPSKMNYIFALMWAFLGYLELKRFHRLPEHG